MSATALRLLACIFMLVDHIGYMIGFMPFRIVGRLAFPVFLYLICNGYRHTSSTLRYALRLGLFALLSQVPFSLMDGRIYSDNWNIFLTLLLGLLCIWAADRMLERPVLRFIFWVPALTVIFFYHFKWIQSDYGAMAIVMIMVIFLLERYGSRRAAAVTAGILAGQIYHMVQQFSVGNLTQWTLIQLFSLGAIPLLAAYNGKKGDIAGGPMAQKLAQWGFYLFYPLHMLLLCLIFQ